MTKYRPNNPKWRTAWKNILDQHNDDYKQSWFFIQFLLHIKTLNQPTSTTKYQRKLHRKLIWELTQKIRDIEYYLTESLKDFNKAKKRREKWEQQQAQYAIDNKQHKDRKRFRHQAKTETSAKYKIPKYMTATKKAFWLEKECEDTRRRGEKFAKW